MTRSEETANGERLDLLDALIYADAFDCAVTLDELWRYSRSATSRETLRSRLREDPSFHGIVTEQDGLYCLAERADLIEERPKRIQRARILQRRAGRVARVLRHFPFVRGLALTGSVAVDDARPQADVDLLVIVAPGRLGIVFLLFGSASRVLGRSLFCPNYYVCEGQLSIAPSSAYIARELAQTRSLAAAAGVLDANPWLTDLFPNAGALPAVNGELGVDTALQRLLEAPLGGAFGNRLEGVARRVALARLRAHHGELGQAVPVDVRVSFDVGVSLRFHGRHSQEQVLQRYVKRRAEVGRRLEERAARESEETRGTA